MPKPFAAAGSLLYVAGLPATDPNNWHLPDIHMRTFMLSFALYLSIKTRCFINRDPHQSVPLFQMSNYSIEITEQLPTSDLDHVFLEGVIRRVLLEEQISDAKISVAIVNDLEIHRVNREFLGHDYSTDVISFLLNEPTKANARIDSDVQLMSDLDALRHPATTDEPCDFLNGELIVSFETAVREATAHGWSPQAELLLYIVHGLLHLCGYDDLTDEARPIMRSRERELLGIWGLSPTGLEM